MSAQEQPLFLTASQLIWKAAGSPAMKSGASGYCCLCGAQSRGMPFASWVKDAFMDFDKLKSGSIVCEACQFTTDDQSVILQKKLRRDKPQRMRNYSHFVCKGQWWAFHKGQKRQMEAFLVGLAEVAVVATSGQKHLVFRAKPGTWQIEEQHMLPAPAKLIEIHTHVERLLPFFSKTEIESGQYAQHRILKCGLQQWKNHEDELKRARGSLVFQLAVWLSQKEDDGPEA